MPENTLRLSKACKAALINVADRDFGGRWYVIAHKRTTDRLRDLGLAEIGMAPYMRNNGYRCVRLTDAGQQISRDLGGTDANV